MQICEGAACIRAPPIFYIIHRQEGSWNHTIYYAQASHPEGLKFELNLSESDDSMFALKIY